MTLRLSLGWLESGSAHVEHGGRAAMDRPPYRSRIAPTVYLGQCARTASASQFDLVKHQRNVEFSTGGGNGRIHCPLRLQRACNYLKTKGEFGGERGIRTLGRVSPTHAFQACSFNHSDISPYLESTSCGTVLNSVAQNPPSRNRVRYVLLFQSFADAGVSMRARIVSDPLMSLDHLR
jgi:hypothetical protein